MPPVPARGLIHDRPACRRIERIRANQGGRKAVAPRRRPRCLNHGLCDRRARNHFSITVNAFVGANLHEQHVLRSVVDFTHGRQAKVQGLNTVDLHALLPPHCLW
jgi:hypothetical protein